MKAYWWEPLEYRAPWLPVMCVCSLQGCLNRTTSYLPSDLHLALFAVKKIFVGVIA